MRGGFFLSKYWREILLALACQACLSPNAVLQFQTPFSNGVATPVVDSSTVTFGPVFPMNGANWNDYVKNTGDPLSINDTACVAGTSSACYHGGEMRKVTIPNLQCAPTMTAQDSVGAFLWSNCLQVGSAAVFYSLKLKRGTQLVSLMNYSTLSWNPISVSILNGATTLVTTTPTVWASNPIQILSSCSTFDIGSGSPGTIFILEMTCSQALAFHSDKSSIINYGGAIVPSPGTPILTTGTTNFHWIEGYYDITHSGTTGGIVLTSQFNRVNSVTAWNSLYSSTVATQALELLSANLNSVTGFATNATILLNSSNNNLIENVRVLGMWLNGSNSNTLSGINTSNSILTSEDGLQLTNSHSNELTRIGEIAKSCGFEV